MKILIVSQHFYPDNFRVNEIAAELVKRGHEVDVLTGLPDYAGNRIPQEFKHGERRDEVYKGVRVHRVSTLPRRKGAVHRMLNYTSFAVSGSLYAGACQEPFDVAFVYQTSPVTMAVPALQAARKYSRKVLLYCSDLWPESVKAWNIGEDSLLYRGVQKLSEKIYKHCDYIAVSSQPFIEYLHHVNGIPERKMGYLPQHGEDSFGPSGCDYLENGVTDLVFTGNVGSVQDVDVIINACNRIRHLTGFQVHIVGDGSELGRMKEMVKTMGLEKIVRFYGRRPPEKMADFSVLADCFLLTLTGKSFIGMTMPAKLQSYLAAGKPILAAANGSSAQIMEEASCGVCGPAGDVETLANTMWEFIREPEAYRRAGRNGRRYFDENFTMLQFMERLEDLFKKMEANDHVL